MGAVHLGGFAGGTIPALAHARATDRAVWDEDSPVPFFQEARPAGR